MMSLQILEAKSDHKYEQSFFKKKFYKGSTR